MGEKLWKKVERFGWLLALCPFIRMIAVCNSLASEKVKKTSDIDLFIVTENNRLWTARFFMKLLTQIFGMRVHHEKIAGRFCLSFFVSKKAMNLHQLAHKFDPHLADFVKIMTPIFGERIYRDFLRENEAWTLPYFKRALEPRLHRIAPHGISRAFAWCAEKILGLFGESTEKFFYSLQMKKDSVRQKQFPKSEGIFMSKDVFKFHERDPRREIAEQFASMP